MTWNELKRLVIETGYVKKRSGARHDIYEHPETGKVIVVERHWSKEVAPGLLRKLLRAIRG